MWIRSAFLALALTGFAALGVARAEPGCNLVERAELPVVMIGARPVVTASINGHGAYFAVDSGAFYSLLSPDAAYAFGLQMDELARRVNIIGVGGPMDAKITTVRSFHLGALFIPDLDFITGGGPLFDEQIIGALGQNVLGRFDVEFDLANGRMRLYEPKGDCGHVAPVYWSKTFGVMEVAPPTFARPNVVGAVTVNGRKLYATFDTGAPNTVMTLKAGAKVGVTPTSPGVIAAGTTWGGGPRELDAWEAPIDKVEVGGETIGQTRLRMAALDLNGESDMLIGADFFLSHRIYLSNRQHRLYFTYNGGMVFSRYGGGEAGAPNAVQARSQTADTAAIGADDLTRHGAADLARGDWGHAIADFTRAITLEPTVARHFHDRALARIAARQPGPAMEDLDEALRLQPGDGPSLMLRGGLDLEAPDPARARLDFDAALAAPGAGSVARLTVAEAYLRVHLYEPAIAQLDLWIANRPRPDLLAAALGVRCEARAELGRDLGKALDDCNAALKRQGRTTAFLDTRGLVNLRLGRIDAAIADYDDALKLQPKLARALYGRGLAKQRKGLEAEAEADLAAALSLDKSLTDHALQIGLIPAACPSQAPRRAGPA